MAKERNLLKLLTNEECVRAYKAALINADGWFISAEAVSKLGQHGKGVSDLVLGTEEYVKALLLLLQSVGINLKDVPRVYMFFSDHNLKHQFAVQFGMMYSTLKPFIGIIHKMKEELHNPQANVKYTDMEKAFLSKDEGLLKAEFKNLPELFDWWEEANQKKNKGFYVDYVNSLETPMQVLESEYVQAFRITSEFKSQVLETISYFEKLSDMEKEEFSRIAKENSFIQIFDSLIKNRYEERRKNR